MHRDQGVANQKPPPDYVPSRRLPRDKVSYLVRLLKRIVLAHELTSSFRSLRQQYLNGKHSYCAIREAL